MAYRCTHMSRKTWIRMPRTKSFVLKRKTQIWRMRKKCDGWKYRGKRAFGHTERKRLDVKCITMNETSNWTIKIAAVDLQTRLFEGPFRLDRRAEGAAARGWRGRNPLFFTAWPCCGHCSPLFGPLGAMAGREAAAGFQGTGISAAPRTPGVQTWAGGGPLAASLQLARVAAFSRSPLDRGPITQFHPWSGRTAEAIAMPGGGEGEPAVAAGSPF